MLWFAPETRERDVPWTWYVVVVSWVPLSFWAADKPHALDRHVVCLIEAKLSGRLWGLSESFTRVACQHAMPCGAMDDYDYDYDSYRD